GTPFFRSGLLTDGPLRFAARRVPMSRAVRVVAVYVAMRPQGRTRPDEGRRKSGGPDALILYTDPLV
ncbi:MAG: hypothetical protein K2X97_22800, partial [Mycobacteriaceae bacterium]|nr:hypothetical protein [Mycobacteriaceae bacterium]